MKATTFAFLNSNFLKKLAMSRTFGARTMFDFVYMFTDISLLSRVLAEDRMFCISQRTLLHSA